MKTQRAILLPRQDTNGNTVYDDAVVFDAVFEETHQADLEVTDNPVETGVMVSDHAYMKPLQLTISAGVSDTPLDGWGGGYEIVGGDVVSGGMGDGADYWIRNAPNDRFASDSGRSRAAYEFLCDMQRKAEPFDVQTGLKLYTNMVCTSIRTSQDKDTANSLIFEATLREVLIVFTQTVKYEPKPKKGATHRQAAKGQDAGEQNAAQVTDEKKKTGLKALANFTRSGKK